METEIFYNYHLERQMQRRSEALELYDKCDYSKLRSNYIHYLKSERKVKELGDISLCEGIDKLVEIKNSLPKNVANAGIEARIEYGDGGFGNTDEATIVVSWTEYNIEDEAKCSSLAKHYAKGDVWKMKHQPNGKDGKRALELYNKLVGEINA